MTARHGGFTLIELVLAMTIAAVIFALAGQGILAIFGSASKSQATREASNRASDVFELFDRDVRYARSPLAATSLRNKDDLRGLLMFSAEKPAACDTNATAKQSTFCRFEEITTATPTQLWLRSDVLTDPTVAEYSEVECVIWKIEPSGVTREVYQGQGEATVDCRPGHLLGTPLQSDLLLKPPPGSNPPSNLRNRENRVGSFAYTVALNNVDTGIADRADPVNCRTRQTDWSTGVLNGEASVLPLQRTFITAASLDLTSFAQRGKSSSSHEEMTITSGILGRGTDAYAYAAGCAF